MKACQLASKLIESNKRESLLSEADRELVVRAKEGSLEAFDRLVFLHQERVFALAYRMLGSREDAADVQQETFLRAWKNLWRFRQESEFSTWLYRITVNLCISRRRRKEVEAVEEYTENLSIPAQQRGMVGCLERSETAAVVRKVLDGVPANHRVLIVLRDMEERSFPEIADILGCSVESARSRLCKARHILRERLRPYLSEELE